VHWIKKLGSSLTNGIILLLLALSSIQASAKGKMVLIIDDVGYNQQDINAIKLDGQLTYAILPHTPFAKEYAELARRANKDVMLHIPMEALSGKDLGPGALMSDMNQSQIDQILNNALLEIPHAIGINNHMGSLLTQKGNTMAWVMDFLKRHQLFFVDSKTSRFSLGEEQADKAGVINFHRNVFIDNDTSTQAMQKQFNLLVRIAQKYRYSVGIAHPYPQTIKFLKQQLPLLENRGVELISISQLLPTNRLQLASAEKQKRATN
jgi:polysaccharide deacetylase 2 family uncharacterized protein YibQ